MAVVVVIQSETGGGGGGGGGAWRVRTETVGDRTTPNPSSALSRLALPDSPTRQVRDAAAILDLTLDVRPCPGARRGFSDEVRCGVGRGGVWDAVGCVTYVVLSDGRRAAEGVVTATSRRGAPVSYCVLQFSLDC